MKIIRAGDRVAYEVMYNDGHGMGLAHIVRRTEYGRVTRIRIGGPRQEPKATIAVEDPKQRRARYVERYVSEIKPAPMTAALDRKALDEIAEMLRDPQWGVGMLEDIGEIVTGTGRSIDDYPDGRSTWGRH